MTDFRRHLVHLANRIESIGAGLDALEEYISCQYRVGLLEELTQTVNRRAASFVPDWDGPLPLRPCKVWAVIGPGGIPDDVEVVGESVSLFSDFGDVHQPDLEEYREKGYVVLAGREFLTLAAALQEQVKTDRLALPYHPAHGIVLTEEERGGEKTN